MTLIVWLIVGALAGWLASIIMGENDRMGPLANIIVGIVGSFIGGLIQNFFANGSLDLVSAINGFNFTSIIFSIIGAIVLLAILKAINKNPNF